MNKTKEIIKLCRYEFQLQLSSKRVWLGYLVGVVIVLAQAAEYMNYANDTGEAVNVWDTFIITGNSYNTVMFLVLGWLLVISEAPFVNHNAMYLMHRTKKTIWNQAMILYIILQAIIYYVLLVLSTMIYCAGNGYFANVWSKPFMKLAKEEMNPNLYHVTFPYPELFESHTVFQAFARTFLLLLLYGIIIGLLLYTCNLFSNQIVGAVAVFLFHFLGYEIMKEGLMLNIKYSLLARSLLVMQIGERTGTQVSGTYLVYAVIVISLIESSNILVRYVDLKEVSKGEG